MLPSNWLHLVKGLAALAAAIGIVSLVLIYFFPAPPAKLVLATGAAGQTYDTLGRRYREQLARSHVQVEIRRTNGIVENLALLNDPKSGVHAAFMQGGISNNKLSPNILSLGRIGYQPFWMFSKAADGLEDIRQLKGKRIAISFPGSGSRLVAEKILRTSGIDGGNSTLLASTAKDATEALNAGKIDALFLIFAPDAPLLHALLTNPHFKLMSFAEAEALTRIYPFLVRLNLPKASIDFERTIPAADTVIIGMTNSVLVRSDIHPAFVDLLAGVMFEEHSEAGLFQQAGEFPTSIDPEYQVAQSARDFYKTGPTFLNRYLPFWMVTHFHRLFAVLLAVAVIVVPIFNLAPRLYQWFLQNRANKIYRRLRLIENELQGQLTPNELMALQADFDGIVRMTYILPMRHSDLFFGLNLHIEGMRERLAARVVDVRLQVAKAG
jgi:TRAP-type uncharacterized transport system substrate-binding protein